MRPLVHNKKVQIVFGVILTLKRGAKRNAARLADALQQQKTRVEEIP